MSFVSALGATKEETWKSYRNGKAYFKVEKVDGQDTYKAAISNTNQEKLQAIRQSDAKYKSLDETVIMALSVSRQAMQEAGWSSDDLFGINIGSSRGATELFEKEHQYYLENKKANVLASPTTTLGNISTWVCHDLQSKGPEVSHSITCSTALHSLLNGIAWIRSGMVGKFIVGGSEAPLTPFTIAQMKALKIYSPVRDTDLPCRAMDLDKSKNTMILGEGAGAVCLEEDQGQKAIAYIIGVGYATELLEHNISISADAICFQKSMQQALDDAGLDSVDAIVMHAPGTIKGDTSEYYAIQKVFGKDVPALTTNKWKLGHTFGASGILSLELALLMMQNQQFIETPFYKNPSTPTKIKTIMVNAVGFGGNAVSVIVSL